MEQHGMGPEHLNDALGEISRQLLALGARLIYGGDLREGGITKMLFELAARYSPALARKDEYAPMIVDVVPYPMHAELTSEELMAWEADFATIAELRYMNQDNDVWSFATRPQRLAQLPTGEWPAALTTMRNYVTRASDARIVLGGKTTGYLGRMPGIAEEALLSAMAGQPLFVVGGFGGAAQPIARSIAGNEYVAIPGTDELLLFRAANGLDEIELQRLATSPHIDEIAVLLMRGLGKLYAG
jgi:hypothetical protein